MTGPFSCRFLPLAGQSPEGGSAAVGDETLGSVAGSGIAAGRMAAVADDAGRSWKGRPGGVGGWEGSADHQALGVAPDDGTEGAVVAGTDAVGCSCQVVEPWASLAFALAFRAEAPASEEEAAGRAGVLQPAA